MSAVSCVVCGRELADGFACSPCALSLSVSLVAAAGHAEDAEAVIARQTRHGGGARGGSDDPLPVDLTAATRYRAIENTIGTWARHVVEETGELPPPWRPVLGAPCRPRGPEHRVHWQLHRCPHLSCEVIREQAQPSPLALAASWLATQTEWLRHRPEADEAFRELHDACQALERLNDSPADKELVGVCDCGRTLYAVAGRAYVVCPERTCQLRWDVAESREILRRHLGDKLVTVSEAARLIAYLDTDRTQDNLRKLIGARLGRLVAHGEIQDEPTYLFREVAALVAAIPRRNREGAAA